MAEQSLADRIGEILKMGARASLDAFQGDVGKLEEGKLPVNALKTFGQAMAVAPWASPGLIPTYKAVNALQPKIVGGRLTFEQVPTQHVIPTGNTQSVFDTLFANPTNPVMQYIKDANDLRRVGLFFGSSAPR